MSTLRIGVINWDCSVPADTTYFGFHATKSLSPAQFRDRTPYYAEVTAENRIEFPLRDQTSYDRELQYAIDAGIDYFAYCWYTDEVIDRNTIDTSNPAYTVDGMLHEITRMRKHHMTNALRDRIGLCAILICSHIYSDGDMDRLAAAMEENCYEKINGRPLVYLFGGFHPEYIPRLQKACEARGLPHPFAVFFNSGGAARPDTDYSVMDGVSNYACCGTNIDTYAELTAYLRRANDLRKNFGVSLVPQFTMGWDPTPRILHPVPWVSYPEARYAAQATREEFLAGAADLADWIEENRDLLVPEHILTFAWNEFEEGSWICPTWTPDGEPDTSHADAFRDVVRYWRERL